MAKLIQIIGLIVIPLLFFYDWILGSGLDNTFFIISLLITGFFSYHIYVVNKIIYPEFPKTLRVAINSFFISFLVYTVVVLIQGFFSINQLISAIPEFLMTIICGWLLASLVNQISLSFQ